MNDGFSGENVSLFRPAFRNHMLTTTVDDNTLIGIIEDNGRTEFRFGGKDLRIVLDLSEQFYLVKVVVPAFEAPDDFEPLDLVDDNLA